MGLIPEGPAQVYVVRLVEYKDKRRGPTWKEHICANREAAQRCYNSERASISAYFKGQPFAAFDPHDDPVPGKPVNIPVGWLQAEGVFNEARGITAVLELCHLPLEE